LNILFFQLFIRFIPKFQQVLPHTTEFVLATALFQANSCLPSERHRAAVLIAAERLNDGCPQTSQFAVGPGMALPPTSLWSNTSNDVHGRTNAAGAGMCGSGHVIEARFSAGVWSCAAQWPYSQSIVGKAN